MTGDQYARLAYLLLLLVSVGGYVLAAGRASLSQTLRHAALWALIFLGAIAAVGLWPAVRDAVAPRQEVLTSAAAWSVAVPLGPDGHYHLELGVNGVPVRFTVDTGASDLVLSRRDALAVGLDPDALNHLGSAMTANGVVRTAAVRLDEVALEGLADRDVPAVVTEGALDASLLGMSYLGRFARIEIADGRLVLTR